jgi:hypothetical protein
MTHQVGTFHVHRSNFVSLCCLVGLGMARFVSSVATEWIVRSREPLVRAAIPMLAGVTGRRWQSQQCAGGWQDSDCDGFQWEHPLNAIEVAELDSKVDALVSTGLWRDLFASPTTEWRAKCIAAVPSTPTLSARLATITKDLAQGHGFALLRGVPVGRYTREEAAVAFLAVGLEVGLPVCQNALGHLLGHVCDHGDDPSDPAVRIYRTSDRQRFHTDSCDVVGLLCLEPADVGGESSLASSAAIYAHMVDTAPALATELERALHWDRKGEVPPGKDEHYLGPIFNFHAGRLLTIYDRRFIETCPRHAGVPPMTQTLTDALDLFESTAADPRFRLDMDLKPGDLQLVHNHTIVHARNAFTDSATQRRHLLRLWLSLDDGVGWELPPIYADGRYGNIDRTSGVPVGGIIAHSDALPTVPIDPV